MFIFICPPFYLDLSESNSHFAVIHRPGTGQRHGRFGRAYSLDRSYSGISSDICFAVASGGDMVEDNLEHGWRESHLRETAKKGMSGF
jgi:hypothetical protein